ncbi:type VI secretion system protein TssA [Falsiroseomonas selenitidurans]|uniref:Type VI secretion system protein TssA n=1 Tax=Falsiroseomonas selenitidurans TaxID=2716335 RepID=A0ABX1EGX9_9PROT|nr:type VI secretion system protein TssA [Falsiroseomonas selenitidurans]NKC34105.1 type VI secretion system protein TssA [Falsiroseomonas selenitidurans]
MAEDPIDLEALLAPLDAGEGGAGTDLREDFSPSSPYQRLRDAWGTARARERALDSLGEGEGEGGRTTEAAPAEAWREVMRIGQEALMRRSKDFQIGAWLTDALVRQAGFDGLAAGARLITGLCEGYWETGFPLPDEDGLDGRAAPISGLAGAGADGTVMQTLRRWPLFRRTDGSPLGLYQWDQAEATESIVNEERLAARRAAGIPELATLVAEARLDHAHLVDVVRAVRAAQEAWAAMEQATEARFGAEAPSTRNVSRLLERILEVTDRLAGPAAAPAATPAAAPGQPAPPPGPPGQPLPAASPGGPAVITTREDALRELGRIAEFFRRTEPHSPLAYTLEEAVRRGRMSLAELLAEVLPDEEARHGLLARLGIRPVTPE